MGTVDWIVVAGYFACVFGAAAGTGAARGLAVGQFEILASSWASPAAG